MSEKSQLINRLKTDKKLRESYIRSKCNISIPSQIRALRRRRFGTQEALAYEAEMKQSRISASESPGTKFNIETLIRLAATFKVGLLVKFVPFSRMLTEENEFSQDTFDVTIIDFDTAFHQEEEKSAGENNVVAIDEWTKARKARGQPAVTWLPVKTQEGGLANEALGSSAS